MGGWEQEGSRVEKGEEKGKNVGRDDLINYILYVKHLLCVRHGHKL